MATNVAHTAAPTNRPMSGNHGNDDAIASASRPGTRSTVKVRNAVINPRQV